MSAPLLVFLAAAAAISEQIAGVWPVLAGGGRGPGAGGEALVGEELGPGRHAGRRREEAGGAWDREAAAAAVQHRGAGNTAAELEPAGGVGGLRDVVLIVTVIHILNHIAI